MFGILMIYSSSFLYAREVFGESYTFLVKQLAFLALGILIVFIVGQVNNMFLYKYAHQINGVIGILLVFFLHYV